MSIKSCLTVLFGILLASAVQAKTYYFIGKATDNERNTFFETQAGQTIGWAESPTASKTVYHKAAAGNDYVIPPEASARWHGPTPNMALVEFPGDSLTITGTLSLKGDHGDNFKTSQIIGNGGTISASSNEHINTIDADFLIPEGQSLTLNVSPSSGSASDFRSIVVGKTNQNKLIGAGAIVLKGSNGDKTTKTSYIDFKADLSAFTGVIQADNEGPLKGYVVKISDKFGGAIESLPAKTTAVRVNYDGLPEGVGLKIASTTVPDVLKTHLRLYSTTADFTAKNFPLMTFPAGTGLTVSDFTVYHATTGDDGVSSPTFSDLGVQVNADGTMTLVANFEGKEVSLNSWTTEPTQTKTTWMDRDDEPGVLTAPVAKFGADTMTTTLNGVAWDGTMPTVADTYTVEWAVAETEDYTGISVSRTFTITPYVNPIESPVRYFSSASAYWHGAKDINAAINALPAAGGVIEINEDIAVDSSDYGYSRKSIVLRSCTDPAKGNRRFAVTRTMSAQARIGAGYGLVVSNVSFRSENRTVPIFKMEGGTLTLGEGAEPRVVAQNNTGTLVQMTDAAGTLRIEGAILTNSTVATPLIDLSTAHAHTVSIGPGTVIEGNKTAGSGFGGKGLLVDLSNASQTLNISGGSLANNTIGGGSSGLIRATAGSVNVSGSPVVYGNVKSDDGSQANVVPANADIVKLTGPLEEGSKVGVRFGAKNEKFGTVTGQGLTREVARMFKNDLTPMLLCSISGADLVWLAPGLVLFLR